MSTQMKTQLKTPIHSTLKPTPMALQVRPFATQTELAFGSEHDASGLFERYLERRAWAHDGARSQLVIQPKLTLGPVGDRYEQEADEVSKQVMRQIHAPISQPAAQSAPQRIDDKVQRAPAIQSVPTTHGMTVDSGIEGGISRARGGGQPLAEHVRAPMEQAFGADFSGVRVHTGGESDRLNHSLQARAFTTGQDIFFRQGAYSPSSSGGQQLLAHELTHVVQQGGNAMLAQPSPTSHASANYNFVHRQLIQRSQIDNTNFDNVETPIAILAKEFGKKTPFGLKATSPPWITMDQFNGSTLGEKVKRPKKVEATIEGPRRTSGVRQAHPPQTEIGNLGDHERVILGMSRQKTYAGGHLISDKILGAASYVEENLAPQYKDFNSPGYRNLERRAEEGAYSPSGKPDTSVPIKATVELDYNSNDYSVTDNNLVAAGILILPSGTPPTGHTIKIPRRVPDSWKMTLEIDKTHAKYNNHYFPPTTVTADTASNFERIPTNLAPQPDQSYRFNISPFVEPSLDTFIFGGKTATKLTMEARQTVPSSTPISGSTASTTTTTAGSAALPSNFTSQLKINNLTGPTSSEYTTLQSTFTKSFANAMVAIVSRKRTRGEDIDDYDDLEKGYDSLPSSYKSSPNRKKLKLLQWDPKMDYS